MTKKNNKSPLTATFSGDKFPQGGDVAKTEVKAWRNGWKLDQKILHEANPLNGRSMKERLTKTWKPFLTSVTTNPHGGRVEFPEDHETHNKFSGLTFSRSGWMTMADMAPEPKEDKPPVIQIENFDGKIKVEKDEPKNKKASLQAYAGVERLIEEGLADETEGRTFWENMAGELRSLGMEKEAQQAEDFAGQETGHHDFLEELQHKVSAKKQASFGSYDAEFLGWQETKPGAPPVPLYNVTKPGHPFIGSTVSTTTLDREGLSYPPPPPQTVSGND